MRVATFRRGSTSSIVGRWRGRCTASTKPPASPPISSPTPSRLDDPATPLTLKSWPTLLDWLPTFMGRVSPWRIPGTGRQRRKFWEGNTLPLRIGAGRSECEDSTANTNTIPRWGGDAVYYRPVKAAPRVQARFVEPIKAMIEASPSFGYRTVAHLLGFNKNTVQRIFQRMGWQVRKRPVGFRPRVQAMLSVTTAPNERWSPGSVRSDGCRSPSCFEATTAWSLRAAMTRPWCAATVCVRNSSRRIAHNRMGWLSV